MNRFILAAAAALSLALITPAAAQTSTNNTSGSQSGSWSQSGVNIGSSPLQAPSAIAPGLIAGGLSCSGSASIGGSAAGWGISFGLTKEDKHCNAREDAKYIQGVTGSIGAAKARLCMMEENRQAFALAGEPCPQDLRHNVRSASSSPQLRNSQPAVTQRTVRSFASVAACERWVRDTGTKAICRAR